MRLPEMISDFIGKEVVVVTLPERNVGVLTEVFEDWIKLTTTNRKGVSSSTVIKVEMITSISEL